MQVAIADTPPEVAAHVKRLHRSHRFLCAISHPITGKIVLYASDTSAVDCLIEARTDYPKGEVFGQYEYLSKEAIAAICRATNDPLAKAMKHLGIVRP